MVREAAVRDALDLSPDDALDERGVYPPPVAGELAVPPQRGYQPPRGEVVLSAEWLSNLDLEQHFSEAPELSAAFAHGVAKRLDVDPRIVVFEARDSVPVETHGRVARAGDRAWVIDSRAFPACLVFPHDHGETVVWGESGSIRLFHLSRAGSPH